MDSILVCNLSAAPYLCSVDTTAVPNGAHVIEVHAVTASGAVVGANVGRGSDGTVYTQDVQRCEFVPTSARPDYWDVTYVFGGYEHRAQTTTPPGATIIVNAQGEPRV